MQAHWEWLMRPAISDHQKPVVLELRRALFAFVLLR